MRLSGKLRYGIFEPDLRFFCDCFINQKDRDLIPNGIDASALGALQAFTVVFQSEWFLADRADQDVEQILGDHGVVHSTPAGAHGM